MTGPYVDVLSRKCKHFHVVVLHLHHHSPDKVVVQTVQPHCLFRPLPFLLKGSGNCLRTFSSLLYGLCHGHAYEWLYTVS